MNLSNRPSWSSIWMDMAKSIARRSYDETLKVGAIIVAEDNSQVLSVGYNGNYKGGPNRRESDEPGQSFLIHAEENALIKCDYNFHKKKHMYVTHSCCKMCSKLVINAGITRVIYGEEYRDTSGINLMRSVGIEVMSIEDAISTIIDK